MKHTHNQSFEKNTDYPQQINYKNGLNKNMKKILFIVVLLLFLSNLTFAEDIRFNKLKERLIKDGFDKQFINEIYSKNSVSFQAKRISNYFIHKESSLNYYQFSLKKSADKAFKYIKKNKKIFDEAEKKYGVDKTIIAAIMLVETRFGNFLGKDSAINILSTMSALISSEKKNRIDVWNATDKEKRLSSKKFHKRADKKSLWAYKELRAFLKYTKKEKLNTTEIKSSYAGAIGIAQFMPSNISKLAVDGNKNSRIDLFEKEDAIYSIANYLKFHGFKKDMTLRKTVKVIKTYNNSTYYANAIISISNLLKDRNI